MVLHLVVTSSHSDEDRLSIYLLTKAPIKKRSFCQWSFVCEFLGPKTPAGDLQDHFHPGLGRSPGEGKGYPLQYSGLENSMDCIVHGVTKSQTRLSDFHFQSAADHKQIKRIK